MLRTFSIQTLGCRVNQYESDQLATLLRSRGLTQIETGGDLRVVNTCSVTVQAASKSRQTVRRAVRLPVLAEVQEVGGGEWGVGSQSQHTPPPTLHPPQSARTLITGCWATSNPQDAANLPGVDAVLGHHDDLAVELDRLLKRWNDGPTHRAGTSELTPPANNTQTIPPNVKKKVARKAARNVIGTTSLPLLGERQSNHQRAYLKVQDGCDAHCTYCIIPQLRPTLWSKPIEQTIEEARALVDAGHRELVLTGIFLGAYGQPTALRRRQSIETAKPLADLVDALCTQVPNLHRLRFSSLEPGDLTSELIDILRSHPQLVPHFHLPLQSGSDVMLHRMNRQYTRDDFLQMIDRVNAAFDRPAITTDIIVGFPGETDAEFEQTIDVVNRSRFIHTHAFSFSPRPGTAAARWTGDFVRGPIVNQRIDRLNALAREHSLAFRERFVGEVVEVLVERAGGKSEIRHAKSETREGKSQIPISKSQIQNLKSKIQNSKPSPLPSPGVPGEGETDTHANMRHGRCERYFDVHFDSDASIETGDAVRVRIERVTPQRTWGEVVR